MPRTITITLTPDEQNVLSALVATFICDDPAETAEWFGMDADAMAEMGLSLYERITGVPQTVVEGE